MIYVCSDVHGCSERFYNLLNKINLQDTDTLYILGDIIDRNPGSLELLKFVMSQKKKNIKLLMGNHEDFMYSYLVNLNVLGKLDIKDDLPYDIWLSPNNGGSETLEEFINEPLETKMDILKYLSELPLIVLLEVNGRKFHLSHAGAIEDMHGKDVLYASDVTKYVRNRIVWYCPYRRDTYLSSYYYPEGYISLIGHVPVQRINEDFSYAINKEVDENKQIYDIDSGCAMYKNEAENEFLKTALSCICLDTMEEYYIR